MKASLRHYQPHGPFGGPQPSNRAAKFSRVSLDDFHVGAARSLVGQGFRTDRPFDAQIDRRPVHCASDSKFRRQGMRDEG
jgi:hypothetical protein